ncbi:MAG: Phosphopantetheine attachment site [Deltaproteobacteria bacterium]|nr:Phosphopantetheine attachment site [Deltaproteobacteria bacterium]
MTGYEEILRELLAILKTFAKSGQTLQEETDLVADLGLDSLRVMKLVVEVEDRFDISIPINTLPNIRTIRDFAVQLEQLLGEAH